MECQARGGLVRVEWGNVENTKNSMHISFTGVLEFWRECLRIVRKWEHLPEWRKAWADVRGSRCQGLENTGSLLTPPSTWSSRPVCSSLRGYWSLSPPVPRTSHAFCMSVRLWSILRILPMLLFPEFLFYQVILLMMMMMMMKFSFIDKV